MLIEYTIRVMCWIFLNLGISELSRYNCFRLLTSPILSNSEPRCREVIKSQGRKKKIKILNCLFCKLFAIPLAV